MAAASAMSTPINRITRDNISVLVRNNTLNNSVEFSSDVEIMDTGSPVRKPYSSLKPITKQLFRSPMQRSPSQDRQYMQSNEDKKRKAKKRKQILLPNSCEKIKHAFVKECDRDGYSPEASARMRKRVLISLFHNKEYSMDFD